MLRLAADENLNNDIVRGVLRRNPDVDIARVQDADLSGAIDPTVLEWAAQEGRVLLTHDVSTMTLRAYERVRDGKPMPGIFEVGRGVPVGLAIEEIMRRLLGPSQSSVVVVGGGFTWPSLPPGSVWHALNGHLPVCQ